jgi:hypothetical protein
MPTVYRISAASPDRQAVHSIVPLTTFRAVGVGTLAGKSQLDRIEWKVDALSQELWFLVDRVSKEDVQR